MGHESGHGEDDRYDDEKFFKIRMTTSHGGRRRKSGRDILGRAVVFATVLTSMPPPRKMTLRNVMDAIREKPTWPSTAVRDSEAFSRRGRIIQA